MTSKPSWLAQFEHTWKTLSANNVAPIDNLYHPKVVFQDPSTVIIGTESLKAHLASLYQTATNINYELLEPIVHSDQKAAQPWVMTFNHPKLASGKAITVNGISVLETTDGLIVSHRDYFDMGEMVYESIPLLGKVIKSIKRRLSFCPPIMP